MTARLAAHPDVAHRATDVLDRLIAAGVDVEFVDRETGASATPDPLQLVRDGIVDLALVGIGALQGSGADALTTVAVLPRREVRDVLVTLSGRGTPLAELPSGARVGLVGERRAAFLAAHRPDVEVVELAPGALSASLAEPDGLGAADLDVADSDGLHAVVMSALDARDAGLVDATVEALDPRSWLPEPGQGAFALLSKHPISEATALDHLPTRTALRAELALLEALSVEHDALLGCLAQPSGRWIRLWAAAASADGRRLVRSDRTGPLDEPEVLGTAVARRLSERGLEVVLAGAAG